MLFPGWSHASADGALEQLGLHEHAFMAWRYSALGSSSTAIATGNAEQIAEIVRLPGFFSA